jgi:hypothetical protein
MRAPDKKARGDSKLDRLGDEQKELLNHWLAVENVTYKEAAKRCLDQFELLTNEKALHFYFGNVTLPWKYARDHEAAKEMAQWQKGDFGPAVKKRLEQLAFQLASSPQVDVKALQAFVKMLTDGEKVALQKDNLKLAIERFRESVKTNVDKGLDALEAEIKGNDEALALFAKMKAAVRKSMEATA